MRPRSDVRFGQALTALLLVALALRLGYISGQDPALSRPILDGAYYLDWARALAAGGGGPGGAYYLAPLYPLLLSGFLRLFGENLGLLFYCQQAAMVGAAGLLGLTGRRLVGAGAGLAAALIFLTYKPVLFFASRPLGEPLAIFLLSLGLFLVTLPGVRAAGAAGLFGGLAALARPNLLLVLVVWAGFELLGRRGPRAAAILAAAALVVVPVSVRNFAVSGHAVPISSNGGLTLHHGNGPGAQGIGWATAGLSGRLAGQREEATRLAGFLAERPLDAVEADRWWGHLALRERLEHPLETIGLGLRRVGLLLASVEISLDYAPGLDTNPWRFAAPLPYGLILALAGAGLYLGGFRSTGGTAVWGAILACAAVPLVFYVSSRYRLPAAVLLCVPAGAGLAQLVGSGRSWQRRAVGLGLALVLWAVSSWMPDGGLRDVSRAGALASRAGSWLAAGDPIEAERDLERALALDPDSVPALLGMAVLLQRSGRSDELQAHRERAERASSVPMPTRWEHQVLASVAQGDTAAARNAAETAAGQGYALDPELLRKLRSLPDVEKMEAEKPR